MKLKNKLEIDSTLKVGAIPTASTSNFSVLFENGGTVSKRVVGDIINKNSTDFIQGISNSFPSIFNYNTSTTPSDANLVVSLKNQLAGTVFAAPTTLNGTPSFRKLVDSDLSETSIFSQLGNYVTLDTDQDITGIKTFSSLYHRIGLNPGHVEFDFDSGPSDAVMRIISNYGNQSTHMQYESYPEGVGFMSFFKTDDNITVSPFTLYTKRVGLSQFTLRTGTNVEVFKMSGDTSSTGSWFFQMPNSNMKFALGYWSNNTAFDIEDVKMAVRGGVYSASNMFANGFKKHNSSDEYVLLGQGGHRPVSDFALAGSLGDYVTLNTEQDIAGKKTFLNAITRFGSNTDTDAHITLNTSPTDSEFWIKASDSSNTGGVNVFSSYSGGAFFGQQIGNREPISFSSRLSDNRVYFNLAKPSNNAVVFLATSNSTSGTIVQAPQSDTKVAFGYFTSNALMTGRSFINRGAGYFSGVLDSNGFIKHGQTDDSVLLAGGGHRPVSDFALATEIPNVTGFVPYTGATANVNLGTRSITSTGGFIGNATTATTLATARTINGTSFNGSANITTARWGTARNITIGDTSKSVNGSANVSWSLEEIGASSISHTHPISDIVGLQTELNNKRTYYTYYNSGLTSTGLLFKDENGDDFSATSNTGKIYDIRLSTKTTAAHTGARYVLYHDGSAWNVEEITPRSSSNYTAQLRINSNGLPEIFNTQTNTAYGAYANVMFYNTDPGKGVEWKRFISLDYNHLFNLPDIPDVSGFIPFTLTRNSVTQKLLNAEKYFGASTSGKYIVIDTGRTTHQMTTYEITVRQYGSSRGSAKFLISWQDNNANNSSIDTILCSNPDLYPSVRLAKDANTNFGCIIIETNMDSLSYCTVVIDRIIGQNTTNSHTIYSAENLDNFINIRTASYNRDSYLWNKGDFTQTNVDNWNTAFGWTLDVNNYVGIHKPMLNNNLDEEFYGHTRWIVGTPKENGVNVTTNGRGFVLGHQANSAGSYGTQFIFSDTDDFVFRNKVNGTVHPWRKVWHDGNLKNVSQLNNDAGYITSSSLPTVNDGQLSLTTGTGLAGSVNFRANQSHNSSILISIANTHKLPTTAEWNALPTTDTITRLRGTSSGTYTSGDLTLLAGANTTITQSGANITIASTNTNTTYSAGNGLTLSGTTFSLPITYSGTGDYVSAITQTTNGLTVTRGTLPTFTDAITSISRNGVNIPITNKNVDIPIFSTSGAGLVPARVGSTTTKYLREDGTWVTPTNTTYSNMAIAELNTGTVTTGRIISASVLNQWLNAKGFSTQTLTAGSNITISGSTISATNTTYSAGTLALLQAGTNTSNRVWSPKILADGVIRKGVHNVNPEGQPFSIHANYGSLNWTGNGFSFVADSEQEFRYVEDEQAIGVNPFQNYGFYLNNQRLRFSNAGNRSELLPSSGVSKSNLPTTGSTQRTLAVGATMGGNTYYANENGLIDLPSSDGILSYSSANGIIVTDWNSFALSEYAMSLGYGSVTSGNYATSVGSLLSTTGFGSTNQGYSNSITKSLGYSLGAYNSVRATLSGAFGIGLINRNDGAFVVGRYNSELPVEPYDTTSPHKQAVFAIGAGRDETDRFTALTVYGDGRADYTHGYDDSTWTNNTLVTKKWVMDNVGGSSSGGGVLYRNVREQSIFDLSSEYSPSVAESVFHVMTERPVVFIGGNEVFHEGYKVTIMVSDERTDVSLDSSQGVKFVSGEYSTISQLESSHMSVTFIYDKEYSTFRVYHYSYTSGI